MSVITEVLEANEQYAATFGAKGELALPPARGFAILTCMDARLDPAKYAGLRKATRTSSATPVAAPATTPSVRWSSPTSCSAPSEWFVIHHTNCGMEFFTDDVIRGLLARV